MSVFAESANEGLSCGFDCAECSALHAPKLVKGNIGGTGPVRAWHTLLRQHAAMAGFPHTLLARLLL